MKHLIRLNDYMKNDIFEIFKIADEINTGKYANFLRGKTVVMFFPNSSIRTRVTFEKGVYLLGGQSILFPTETLDKKEKIEDVIKYLNNWADVVVVRHQDIDLLDEMVKYSDIPINNAMTSVNHPCEILSDVYSLSKLKDDYLSLKYLFVGAEGNIGLTWKEAADIFDFELIQSCPKGYEIKGLHIQYDLEKAIVDKDIILTDSLNQSTIGDFTNHQITKPIMELANKNAIINPCPPFFRGEEVSADIIDSDYFVGHKFKISLLNVQQAIIIFNLQ